MVNRNPALSSNRPRKEVAELAGLFLKLGAIGFGGPAAHIAMMEDEVVRRRRWLTREEFLDLLGATNLIPGPNSTEMAIHIGHRRGGWLGLVVAGVCFILPAMLIVLACAWAYQRFAALPQIEGLLYGVKPVIIAVVLQALWGLGRSAIRSLSLGAVAVASAALVLLGVNEIVVLFGMGLVVVAIQTFRGRSDRAHDRHSDKVNGKIRNKLDKGVPSLLPIAAAASGSAAVSAAAFNLTTMFLFFLKVGSILFGSGYVLLAFLRADLVERWGWLTETELLDAVAIGQVTPGPVFTTATFIGYLLGGTWGAIVATIGIFLPAFVFVALSGPLVPRIRRSAAAGAFLDGVIVASLALMAVVTWHLSREAVMDVPTGILTVASALLLLRYRVNSVWLVAGGGLAGLIKTVVF